MNNLCLAFAIVSSFILRVTTLNYSNICIINQINIIFYFTIDSTSNKGVVISTF